MRSEFHTSALLAVEDDHLLSQKSILRDQVLSAAKEIGHHSFHWSIGSGLSPRFHPRLDRFETAHQPLSAFIPEVFETHRWVAFGIIERIDLDFRRRLYYGCPRNLPG